MKGSPCHSLRRNPGRHAVPKDIFRQIRWKTTNNDLESIGGHDGLETAEHSTAIVLFHDARRFEKETLWAAGNEFSGSRLAVSSNFCLGTLITSQL